ncbi:MAG: phosphotransferase [Hyphomicrobiales bacterium]|nr:MAG: phosphotransferase [Hyphomicrobiales bacterium]
MSLDAFAAPGSFYKGNLHTHSTRSDGKLDPADVCRRYAEHGYDFLCLSDHFLGAYNFPITDTRPYRTDSFTTVLGAELHAMTTDFGDLWHILAVGLPEDFADTGVNETAQQLADRAVAAGAFVAIAHPEWYGLSLPDALTMSSAHAVEVYNHTSHVHSGRGGGAYCLDMLLNGGRRINALACDDTHWNVPGDENRDAFGGWVMVKAETNEPDALVDALRAGHYYSSQGPAIEAMHRDGNELVVEASACQQIILAGPHSLSVYAAGEGMQSARLPLERFAGKWGRLMVIDKAGLIAWSNPMWF